MTSPTVNQTQTEQNVRTSSRFWRFAIIAVGVAAACLALIASFVLANWAEASTMHHGIQHALLFLGGMGVGASGVAAIKTKREN